MKRFVTTLLAGTAVCLAAAGGCAPSIEACSGSTQSCFEVSGSGDEQTCTFTSGNIVDCAAQAMQPGSCPTANLAGCCVTSVSVAGCTETTASCFYDPMTAADAQAECTTIPGSDTGEMWVTTAP